MKVSTRIKNTSLVICEEEISDNSFTCSGLKEKTVKLKGEPVRKLSSVQLKTEGFLLMDTHMVFEEEVSELFEVCGENIAQVFMSQGNSIATIKDGETDQIVESNFHNLRYSGNFYGEFRMKARLPVNYFIIILSKSFFLRLLNQNTLPSNAFVQNVIKGIDTKIFENDRDITSQMNFVINEIRNCTKKGIFKRLFLESKVIELLMLQLEQYLSEQETKPSKHLKGENDLKKIHQARTIIECDLNNTPTITEMSKMIGINEFKLKNGFKEVFNTTIHAYATKLKMEQAKKMLLEGKTTIWEIGHSLGYKNVAHFSSAFKKHFGMSPGKVRGFTE